MAGPKSIYNNILQTTKNENPQIIGIIVL